MIKTKRHLLYVLKVSEHEFDTILDNIDQYYYEEVQLKFNKDGTPKLDKNGVQKQRVLNPSTKRLKVIQKRIKKNVLTKLPLPDYAYGGVTGRDNITNAKKHQGKKYKFGTDIKDFFPSITHKKVFEMFIAFDFSPTVSRYLTKLTTHKGRLPQGAPTSSALANLVFIKIGRKLECFAFENDLTFTSFVDDLTFSSSQNFKPQVDEIVQLIESDVYKINHRKTYFKSKRPLITGVIANNNGLALPQDYMAKLGDTKGKTKDQIRGLATYANRVKNA